MKRIVLDVGNCGPDHSAICQFLISNFDVEVLQAHGTSDTLAKLRETEIDLVLINRKLDQDYSDGTEVLKKIKADAGFSRLPVMLITNHAEYQDAAEALGAVRGFGKLELGHAATRKKVAQYLDSL